MSARPSNPALAFLWRASEISQSVVDVERRTSVGAIFDVDHDREDDTAKALREAGARQIKIPLKNFMAPAFERFLQESRVDTLWVDYHPALADCTPQAFLERLQALSEGIYPTLLIVY